MKRLPLVSILLLATVIPAAAVELDARSSIDTVTVYPDGATVTRLLHVDLAGGDTTITAKDFPPTLDPSSLRVEGEADARLLIGSIDVRAPRIDRPPVSPELEQRIEALKDERAVLNDKIAAATVRRKFVERFADNAPAGFGDKGEARPLAEWRAAFTAVAEEIASAAAVIREAKLRQRDIDRELARLDTQRAANPPRKMEVRIDVSSDVVTSATLRVSYTVRGARWSPLYDARLDSGAVGRAPALELVRRAEIMQDTGEDWSEVALAVSTVRTAKGGSAPDLRPLIVHYPEPPRPLPSPAVRSDRMLEPRAKMVERGGEGYLPASPRQQADERETAVETGGFQVVFRIPGRVVVPANEGAKAFRIATARLAPELLARAVPALDTTAFLEASFKQPDEAPLLPGRVSLYRDGVFVGNGAMALTQKDETVRLGFGADDRVKIVRTNVRKIESKTGIISSAKLDEREFKITVRNSHDTNMRIVVEDQLPVSETSDVQVEVLPVTTAPSEHDVRDRRGVIAWNFDAKPGEVRDIKLGWRVRWPADRAIVFEARGS